MSPALTEIQEKTLTGGFANNQKDNHERQEGATEDKLQQNEVKCVKCASVCKMLSVSF